MARVGLLGRRLEWSELATIRLGSLHLANVHKPGSCRLDRVDQVAEHRTVDGHLAGLRGLLLVRSKENVGDVVKRGELVATVPGVEQVDREESDVFHVLGRFPGQGDDFPVGAASEALDNSPADDAAGSSNKCDLTFHGCKALAGKRPSVQCPCP